MSKPTPGPWGVERTAHRSWIGRLRSDGKVEDIVCSTDCDPLLIEWARERNIANARLIAAAPELLAALQECAERLAIHMKHSEDLVAHMAACRVIAKATGSFVEGAR